MLLLLCLLTRVLTQTSSSGVWCKVCRRCTKRRRCGIEARNAPKTVMSAVLEFGRAAISGSWLEGVQHTKRSCDTTLANTAPSHHRPSLLRIERTLPYEIITKIPATFSHHVDFTYIVPYFSIVPSLAIAATIRNSRQTLRHQYGHY